MADDLWASSDAFDYGRTFDLPRSAPVDDPFALTPFASSGQPVGGDLIGMTPATAEHPVLPATPPLVATLRRGQVLALTGLLLGLASAVAAGLGTYAAFDSIQLDTFSLDEVQTWSEVGVAGLCGGMVAVAVAIVAMVRSRPRTLATVALVVGLSLPLVSFVLGVKFGFDAMVSHASEDLSTLAERLAGDPDAGGLVRLLISLLGG